MKTYPPLLYFWFNVESQGINTKDLVLLGLFSNTEQRFFFGAEEISQAEFDQYLTNHVSRARIASKQNEFKISDVVI